MPYLGQDVSECVCLEASAPEINTYILGMAKVYNRIDLKLMLKFIPEVVLKASNFVS